MTDKQWSACTNPTTMLQWLDKRASHRKLRLLTCAYCRRVWHLLEDRRLQQAVETSERFADGLAGWEELEPAREAVLDAMTAAQTTIAEVDATLRDAERTRQRTWNTWVGTPAPPVALVRTAAEALAAQAGLEEAQARHAAAEAVWLAVPGALTVENVADKAVEAMATAQTALATQNRAQRWMQRADDEAERPVPRARAAVRLAQAAEWVERAAEAAENRAWRARSRAEKTERQAQCDLVRDLFGNPFRPVALDLAWLRWNEATVMKIAQAIYADRRFGDLPVLGDALEEAGCHHADILGHCRSQGKHARGCWAVDTVLGKEP
jgi:hypothetical protein